MGTSVSNRSPNTSRWRAAVAAYARGVPEERASLELVNAAHEWVPSLTSDAVGAYVAALEEAWGQFPAQVQAASRGDQAITEVVDTATRAALASSGDASAVAFAERALRRVLIESSQSGRAVADSTPAQIETAWLANRGATAAGLVAQFAGELVSQFAKHAVTRDVAGLVGHQQFPSVNEMRRYADEIASRLRHTTIDNVLSDPGVDPAQSWRRGVIETFAVRRTRDA